jgi:hypothetical protein
VDWHQKMRAGTGGPSGLLLRGESLVASAGLAAAAILLGAMGTSAWWTLHNQHESLLKARQEQVRTVAQLLARSCEGLLTDDSASSTVRSLVSGAALSYRLQ